MSGTGNGTSEEDTGEDNFVDEFSNGDDDDSDSEGDVEKREPSPFRILSRARLQQVFFGGHLGKQSHAATNYTLPAFSSNLMFVLRLIINCFLQYMDKFSVS